MTVLTDVGPSSPILLRDMKHSVIERNHSRKLTVEVYIKDVLPETFEADFDISSFKIKFQTRNTAFHACHNSANYNTSFVWNPQVFGEIEPQDCSCTVNSVKIAISLTKTSEESWNRLTLHPSQTSFQSSSNVQKINRARTPLSSSENLNAISEQETITNGNFNRIPDKHRPGFVGLDNIGNTCYLNSVIQCLINTIELKNYFEVSSFMEDINRDNPLGTNGSCAINFSAVLRKLWEGLEVSIAPAKLKELISQKVPQFAGYMQHDAQEFLTFLLDAVHEDLNRVKEKVYIEDKEDASDKSDRMKAKEAWDKYKLRNDSIIVDLFHGQFKSCLICPQCKKKSVTFDPFLSLSVPIPTLPKVYTIHLFYLDTKRRPEKHSIEVKEDATGHQLKDILSYRTGISSNELQIIDILNGMLRNVVDDDILVRNPNFLVAYELCNKPGLSWHLVFQRLLEPVTCNKCDLKVGSSKFQCSRCKAAYCSERCKIENINVHACHLKSRYKFVGVPFCVGIPSSGISFQELQLEVLSHARRFVEVVPIKGTLDLNSNEGEEVGETSLNDYFYMKCLNEDGEGIEKRFETNGLVNPSTRYLTVDWRCNPESSVCCSVKEKQLDFKMIGFVNDYALHVQDCLRLFQEPETLSQEEAWYCSQCKEHVQATKQLGIWKLPKILIIHLKRFSFKNSFTRNKIDTFVGFTLNNLDLSPFIQEVNESAVYDLFGVVNHKGSIYGGHYTAYARLLNGKSTDLGQFETLDSWSPTMQKELLGLGERYNLRSFCSRENILPYRFAVLSMNSYKFWK
ncbi:hypothetical protein QYM36_019377 [Artemia franciscana]|uniref:Ubiquitin carboxyl-terminal hydrolase n=1 Tax=Artemia franciscana TaxID=6661 RepID=A0AA88H5C5_ARTSF|nr:hypothetical protein QYM36_019377 [Artemia franciscana]